MKNLYTCLAFFAISGCQGLGWPTAIEPNFVLNEEGPTGVGAKSPSPSSLIVSFSNSYHLAQCKSDLVVQTNKSFLYYSSIVDAKNPEKRSLGMRHVTCAAQSGVTEARAAQKMYDDGIILSDAVCRGYFRRLGNQNQDLDYYAELTNNLGGFSAAILGITESSSSAIAITAASFASIVAGFESFDEAYHFNPDLQSVEDMIFRAKTAFRAEYNTVSTFKAAVEGVDAYQSICQTSNIRKLVNEAVSKAELTAAPRTARSTQIPITISNQMSANLTEIVGAPARISRTAIEWLISAANGSVRTDEDKAKFDSLLATEGISSASEKISSVYIWMDKLRASEPRAYQQLLQDSQNRKASDLPDLNATDEEKTKFLSTKNADSTQSLTTAPDVRVE